MRKPAAVPLFATEVELCAAYIDYAKRFGWLAYPETGGWDILLVAPDGTQVGIEAKLKFNMEVLAQAVEGDEWNSSTGPDFGAILVPGGARRRLCDALGITALEPSNGFLAARGGGRFGGGQFYPPLPGTAPYGPGLTIWHYRNPGKRIKLPDYVPDVPAGASAPVQLTDWKVNALRLVAVAEVRGHITRKDFKRYGIDHRRWSVERWMLPVDGAEGVFRIADPASWALQHPVVYPQVLADIRADIEAAAAGGLPLNG